jgi:hypothetical protein
MYTIKRMKFHRLVHFTKVKPDVENPVFTFLQFTVHPTVVYAKETEPENKETVYLAFNTERTQQVIIYVTQHRLSKRITVRYWRSGGLDSEFSWLLVQGFVHGYLKKIPAFKGGFSQTV